MSDKAFLPNPINVRIGDIVTWKNTDIETHTVTCGSSDDSSQKVVEFDSGLLDPDQSFEHKFEKVLADQYEPEDLIKVMVQLIAADKSKFRNVHPKYSELYVKDFQKKAWTLTS